MDNEFPGLLPDETGLFPYRHTEDDRFQYRVKIQPVAGQLEVSIRPVDTRLAAMAARRAWEGYPVRTSPSANTDREDNIRKAKLRAKSKVKLLAMELGVDRMLTFTIRHTGKPMEYDQVLKAWDYLRRMAVRYDKTFRYVAAPEVQKNGQFHIHAGVHGFINVKVMTRMWQTALNLVLGRPQSMVHGEDSPGTCNIQHRPIMGPVLRKAKRIAGYIAKYIGKSLDAEFNRKKYFHTDGIKITPARAKWLEAQTRDKAIVEVLKMMGLWVGERFLEIDIWKRDACSAWFSVETEWAYPPPF